MHFYNLQNNEEEKEILSAFESHTQINSHRVFPYIASASAGLIKHFTQGYNHGITVTCPGFYGPQGRSLRLGLHTPDINEKLTAFNFTRVINDMTIKYGFTDYVNYIIISEDGKITKHKHRISAFLTKSTDLCV